METKRRLINKYRFQLLQTWITKRYKPAKALDVGGGKGSLAYLLNINGWKANVVDPNLTDIFTKYKDLESKKRVFVNGENFKRIVSPFKDEMIKDYDLIIGLHAHGSNLQIINACKKYDKDFLLLPCCVIDEPLTKKREVDWLQSLVEYASNLGFEVKKDSLNFKGQNILIYTDKRLERK